MFTHSSISRVRLITVVLALLALSLATIPRARAATNTVTFDYTGSEQTFVVPDGVTSIHVVAIGGRGVNPTLETGRGARVEAELPVTPGSILYVYVGGNGVGSMGGFNGGGGGDNGGGGGGASDLRSTSNTLGSRLLVAAGGGGAGSHNREETDYDDNPLIGTGAIGGNAQQAGNHGLNGKGGGAGTSTNGGAGGAGGTDEDFSAGNGEDGTAGRGGTGGGPGDDGGGGGGGGGGYYGGGGGGGSTTPYCEIGCSGGGGGGGSNYVTTGATNVVTGLDATGTPSITISYTPPNSAPVANNDSATVLEDSSVTINVLANDSDPDGDALHICCASPVANYGYVAVHGNGLVTYTPIPNFYGSDSFTYQACDPSNACTEATVNINVQPMNDGPFFFTTVGNVTVAEDSGAYSTQWADGITPGPNENDQSLNFSVTNTNNGLFSVQPMLAPSGVLSFAPEPNAHGSASVTAVLHDNGGTASGGVDTSAPITFIITVTPINDPPVATNDNATTAEDTTVTIPVLANDSDVDGDTLVPQIVTQPSNGTASVNSYGTITYTPNANFNGSDSFSYKAFDGHTDSNIATVSITILPVNDGPTISVSGGQCLSDSSANGRLNLTVADVDNAASSLTLAASSSNTKLVPNSGIVLAGSGGTRTLTVKAADKQSGTATITLTLSDGSTATTLVVTMMVGTPQSEALNGTSGVDMLFGLNGRNTLSGGDGNDLLCGGNGDDLLNGGSGNDVLAGGRGNDTLNGNDGDDMLTGGQSADAFSGGAGNDTATDFKTSEGDTKDTTT